jgi:quercetin dioxygenase-like cupin family protein
MMKKPRKKSPAKKKPKAPQRSKGYALQRTTVQGNGDLKYLSWDGVELETLNPLLQRQLICGKNVMLARVLLKKGCIVPMHSHVNEQLAYVIDGALKFLIDGKEIVVRAGQVLTIPPNMPHQAEALEDTVDLDIFNPPRADWLEKRDSYLRK